MLVDLQSILQEMEQKRTAVGSFNTPNLEMVMGVVQAAEKNNCPVILMHAQVHESIMPLDIIGPVMLAAAHRAKVPVCVHLDHGESIDYIERAIQLGFSSVMYDGSSLAYEENLTNTKKVVSIAHKAGVSVEAEIGVIGRGGEISRDRYTDPAVAKEFAAAAGIDALACAFGTAHGIYKKAPQLDFARLKAIRRETAMPLVMHGGSGVSFEDYRAAITCGVRKINYYTYMAKYVGETIRDRLAAMEGIPYYHDLVGWGREAATAHAGKVMRVFSKDEP